MKKFVKIENRADLRKTLKESFCHCSAERLPNIKNVGGIHFLFDAPHQIPSEMLVGIGRDSYRGDDLWDYCAREYFYRVFL